MTRLCFSNIIFLMASFTCSFLKNTVLIAALPHVAFQKSICADTFLLLFIKRWLKNNTKHYGCNWQLIMKLFKQVAWHHTDIPGMNQRWQKRYADPIYFNCALQIGFISQVVRNEDAKTDFSKAVMSRRNAPDDSEGDCGEVDVLGICPALADLEQSSLSRCCWRGKWRLERLAHPSAVCNRK